MSFTSDFPEEDNDFFDFFSNDGTVPSDESAGSEAQDQLFSDIDQLGVSDEFEEILREIGIAVQNKEQASDVSPLVVGDACPMDQQENGQQSASSFDQAFSDAHYSVMVPYQEPPPDTQDEGVPVHTEQPETLVIADDDFQEMQEENGFSGQQQVTLNDQLDLSHDNGLLQQENGPDNQQLSEMTYFDIVDDSQPVLYEHGIDDLAPSDTFSDEYTTAANVAVEASPPELRKGRFVIRRSTPTKNTKSVAQTDSGQDREQPTNTPPSQKNVDIGTAGNTSYHNQQHGQGSTIQPLGYTVPHAAGSLTKQFSLPNRGPMFRSRPVPPHRELLLRRNTPGFQPHHQKHTQASLAQINQDAQSEVTVPSRPAASSSKTGLFPVRTIYRPTLATPVGYGYRKHANGYMSRAGSGIGPSSRPQQNKHHDQHARQALNMNHFDAGYGDQEPQASAPTAGPGIRLDSSHSQTQFTDSQRQVQTQQNDDDIVVLYHGRQTTHGPTNQKDITGQTSKDAHRGVLIPFRPSASCARTRPFVSQANKQQASAPRAGPGIRWNKGLSASTQQQPGDANTGIVPYRGQQTSHEQRNQEDSFGEVLVHRGQTSDGQISNQIALPETLPPVENPHDVSHGNVPNGEQQKQDSIQNPQSDHMWQEVPNTDVNNDVMVPASPSGSRTGDFVTGAPQPQPATARTEPVVLYSLYNQYNRRPGSFQTQAEGLQNVVTARMIRYRRPQLPQRAIQFPEYTLPPVTESPNSTDAASTFAIYESSEQPEDHIVTHLRGDPSMVSLWSTTDDSVPSGRVPKRSGENDTSAKAEKRKKWPSNVKKEAERKRKLDSGLYKLSHKNAVIPKNRAELTESQYQQLKLDKEMSRNLEY